MRSVIIAGSRTLELTVDDIDRAIAEYDPGGLLWVPSEWRIVVCGMAPGVDMSGLRWAEAKGKEVDRMPITEDDYDLYGKQGAPKMRNKRMAEIADGAVLFWDGGISGGTPDMCIRMTARQKPVAVIPWDRQRHAPWERVRREREAATRGNQR